MNLKENTRFASMLLRNSHSIESYDFLKSTFITDLGDDPFLEYHFKSAWLNNILSIIFLLSVKVD